MKTFFLSLIVLASTLVSLTSEAHLYVGPVRYGAWYGVPYAHGYWGWGYTGYPMNPYFGGFSYYPYYWQPAYIPSYGAIAYSVSSDKVGYSYGMPSKQDAFGAAVNGCNAEDCSGVVWVQGGCAAVTSSKTSQRLDWAYSQDKEGARRLATRACSASGAKDCEVRAWVCAW